VSSRKCQPSKRQIQNIRDMIRAIPFAMPRLHIVSQAFGVSVSSPLIPCMKKLSS
jgi:hypothetical protein